LIDTKGRCGNRGRSRDRDRGGCNRKSKCLLTRIIGLLRSRRKERARLKETNISRDNVPPKIWRITSITFLKMGITEEKTLERFCSKFIFTRSKVVNKACAPEDAEW
jgi:hypothetical protein